LSLFAVNGDNITDVTSLMSVVQGYHQAVVTLPTASFSGNQTFVASTLIDIYNGTNTTTGSRILLRGEETGSQRRVLQSMIGQKRTVTADVSFVNFQLHTFSQQSFAILIVLLSVGFGIFLCILALTFFLFLRSRMSSDGEREKQKPTESISPPVGI